MSNPFAAGMELGRRAVNDRFERERQAKIDERLQWEFEQRKLEAERQAAVRGELADVAAGVTPGAMPPGVRLPEVDPGLPGDAGTIAPPAGIPLAPRYTPQQAQERIAGISLKSGDVKGYNAAQDKAKDFRIKSEDEAFIKDVMKLTPEQLMAKAKTIFSDNPKIPAKLEVDAKGVMTVVRDDGTRSPPMSDVQARTFLYAAHKMGQGDVEKGLQLMLEQGDKIRSTAREDRRDENVLTDTAAKYGLQLRGQERQDRHMGILEKAEARKAAAAERVASNATKDRWSISGSITDKDGNVLLVNERTGETKPMVGVRPVRDPRATAPATKQDIASMAKDIITSGEINPVTKKPFTATEAREIAQEFYGIGEKVDEVGDLAKILLANKDKKQQAGAQAVGPKAGLSLSERGPGARRAPIAELSTQELQAIPPTAPAGQYEVAQQELARRAAAVEPPRYGFQPPF
jgi:hypothetical protein